MNLPTFAYRLEGPSGAPVITFVPGIGNTADFWADQAAALKNRYQVLTFDPWGHGDSPQPPTDCKFATCLDGIVALWDRLGIVRSHVVGLGFGGSSALALALAYPQRVTSIVACCCRPRQPDDRRDFWRNRCAKAAETGMAAITQITVDRWLSEEFRASHPEIDQALRKAMNRTTVEGYQAYVSAFVEMDFSDRLAELAVPVQLVAAEMDHGGGPVAAMQAMASVIPDANLTVIPGSGHICVAEAPDALGAILASFFTHLTPPSS